MGNNNIFSFKNQSADFLSPLGRRKGFGM